MIHRLPINSFCLSIVIIGLLSSCAEEPDNDDTPVAQYFIGDTANFQVTELDSVLGGSYNSLAWSTFDIDNDGIDDIEFITGSVGSPAQGIRPAHEIRTLGAHCFLNVFEYSDSLFMNTTIDTVFEDNLIYVRLTRSCESLNGINSLISTTPNLGLTQMQLGDSIGAWNDWQQIQTLLVGSNWGSYHPDSIVNGYEYIGGSLFHTDCHKLPMDEWVYLGFRLVDLQGTVRFGWLKLIVQSTGANVHLMEIGIQ